VSNEEVELHVITTIKQHPMVGEYWQSHCSCGGGVTMLYRAPEEAEWAARDHQPGQRASDWDRAEQDIVRDAEWDD
jgi:hypothetical protein